MSNETPETPEIIDGEVFDDSTEQSATKPGAIRRFGNRVAFFAKQNKHTIATAAICTSVIGALVYLGRTEDDSDDLDFEEVTLDMNDTSEEE